MLRRWTPTIPAALRDLAAARDPVDRVHAAAALARATGDDRARAASALLAALSDAHPDVRAAAAESLAALAHAPASRALAALAASDPDIVVQQAALAALGRTGGEGAAAAVRQAARSASPHLRFQATAAAVRLALPDAAEILERLAADPDPEVRASAAAGLGDLPALAPHAAATLARLLDDGALAPRVEAAVALARHGDPRGAPLLASAAGNPQVALVVAPHLERLAERLPAAPLRAALRAFRTPPVARVYIAAALAKMGDPAGRRALVKLLRHREPPVRGLAIERLGAARAPWAVDALEAFLATRLGRRHRADIEEALQRAQAPLAGTH